MANNTAKITVDTSSTWDSFTMPAGGTSVEIRKSVQELRNTINQEKKAFSEAIVLQATNKDKR